MSQLGAKYKYQDAEPPDPQSIAGDVVISPDTRRSQRVPPGQTRTRKWPVLHAHSVPQIALDTWSLEIGGLVARPVVYDWNEFRSLPRTRVFADFHCVTRWSRLGNLWEGVSVRDLLNSAGIQSHAHFAVITAYDAGWTTNLPLADLLADDVLLADTHDGELLHADHGGPVRLIIPRLYAWKSAKWIRRIDLLADDAPGFWEQLGYHDRGNPWTVNHNHPDGERVR